MGALARGFANAFRNGIRAISIITILALSIAFALVMVASSLTVRARINGVRSALGNTISIAPSQAMAAQGGSPLTDADLDAIRIIPGVVRVTKTISANLTPEDSSLQSSIGGAMGGGSAEGMPERSFPVFVTGTNDPRDTQAVMGNKLDLVAGDYIDAESDTLVAMIGKGIADTNGLTAGSTFQAWGSPITVQAVFTTGNVWADNVVIFPIRTVQQLTGRTGEVSMAVATVDSYSKIAPAATAMGAALGMKAQLTSAADIASQATGPLEDIRRIADLDLIAAMFTASVIVLFSMLMVVRERRREIGVLKAIGASNRVVVVQFLAEALTLTGIASIAGGVLAAVLNNAVFSRLVSANVGEGPDSQSLVSLGFTAGWGAYRVVKNSSAELVSSFGIEAIAYAVIVAVAIAVVGSAVPAYLLARVKPAEVMRAE